MQPNYQLMQPTQQHPAGYPPPTPTPKRHVDVFLILFVVSLFLLLLTAGYAIWATIGRQDYKNNVDKKIAAANEIQKQQTASQKDNEFLEKEKQPLKEYKGPGTFGSLSIQYPKTWSAYITETTKGGATPIDGYMHPNFIPGITSGTQFALRFQVVNQPYDQQLKQFESKVKTGKIKVSPFKADKVPDVLGSYVEGEINTGQKDFMVMFPIRDKTVKVWTESEQFLKDFKEIILPKLLFVP